MIRGTALTMLARAQEDLLVAQQVVEQISADVINLEVDEQVRDSGSIINLRDAASAIRLAAERIES